MSKDPFGRSAAAAVLALALGLGVPTTVLAQSESPSSSSSLTQPQRVMLNAIFRTPGGEPQGACPTLAGQETRTSAQQELLDYCTPMVQVFTGGDPDALGSTSLDAALQQVANEELQAIGAMSVDAIDDQLGSIALRLAQLRGFGPLNPLVSQAGPRGVPANALAHTRLGSVLDWSMRGSGAGDGHEPDVAGIEVPQYGFFLTGQGSFGDHDDDDRQPGFDYYTAGATTGIDFRLNPNTIVGGALGYRRVDTDFDSSPRVSGGDIETDAYSLSLYSTLYFDNVWVDLVGSAGVSDYEIDRAIRIPLPGQPAVQTANADTHSLEYAVSGTVGYTGANGPLGYETYLRGTFLNVDVDGFSENASGAGGLALRVRDYDFQSTTSALGAKLSYTISTGFGVMVPQLTVEYLREWDDDRRTITAFYVHDPTNSAFQPKSAEPDRDHMRLGFGVSTVMRGGVQGFLSYETLTGINNFETHLFHGGVRLEF